MKVRILSGNQQGAMIEMPQGEAESNIATGYAEAVGDEPAKVAAVAPRPRIGAATRRAAARAAVAVAPDPAAEVESGSDPD